MEEIPNSILFFSKKYTRISEIIKVRLKIIISQNYIFLKIKKLSLTYLHKWHRTLTFKISLNNFIH